MEDAVDADTRIGRHAAMAQVANHAFMPRTWRVTVQQRPDSTATLGQRMAQRPANEPIRTRDQILHRRNQPDAGRSSP
jgi:hypothetical protein